MGSRTLNSALLRRALAALRYSERIPFPSTCGVMATVRRSGEALGTERGRGGEGDRAREPGGKRAGPRGPPGRAGAGPGQSARPAVGPASPGPRAYRLGSALLAARGPDGAPRPRAGLQPDPRSGVAPALLQPLLFCGSFGLVLGETWELSL